MEWKKRSAGLALVLLAAACAGSPAAQSNRRGGEPPTACDNVIPDCRARRLPDVVLSQENPKLEGFRALGPVTEPLEGVISFDQALAAAWREDGPGSDADTVQVALGSADPRSLHWNTDHRLFYGVYWTGVCVPLSHPARPSPPPVGCDATDWATIVDAYTGAFIVGGS